MRASQWQGTTASLLAKSLNLPRIIQPGFSCDSQERRVFTVRTNSGVSSTIPRSAIQSALCSQLQPLLDGNTRQSHPQGDWCIDPDLAAPHYADLMCLLNPGSIYLPIPGTSDSTIVKVDNSFRLSPLMSLPMSPSLDELSPLLWSPSLRRFNEIGSGLRATSDSLTTAASAHRGGVDATPSSLFGPLTRSGCLRRTSATSLDRATTGLGRGVPVSESAGF